MIQTMIKLRLPANRLTEAMSILRPLVESAKTAPGCIDCGLHQDVLDAGVLVIEDRWTDELGLLQHLRSEPYRVLLLVMEMAEAVPVVRFDVISHTAGLEIIWRARTGFGGADEYVDALCMTPAHDHPEATPKEA